MRAPLRRVVLKTKTVRIVSTDHAEDATDQATTWTFNSRAIGAKSNGDRLVIAAGVRNNAAVPTITAISVNGVPAASVVTFAFNTQQSIVLFVTDHPGGALANIVVTCTNGGQRCGIAIWRMSGAASSVASATGSDAAHAPESSAITIPPKGSAIGYAYGAVGTSATWSNLDEDFDTAIESTVLHTGAHRDFVAGGSTTITCTWAVDPTTNGGMIVAAWSP